MKRQLVRLLTAGLVMICIFTGVGLASNVTTPKVDITVTGSATLIATTNMSRESMNCTNTSASVNVRWGDVTVTASAGQQIKAGLPISIPTTAAIYMISEGANVTISCTEETR